MHIRSSKIKILATNIFGKGWSMGSLTEVMEISTVSADRNSAISVQTSNTIPSLENFPTKIFMVLDKEFIAMACNNKEKVIKKQMSSDKGLTQYIIVIHRIL